MRIYQRNSIENGQLPWQAIYDRTPSRSTADLGPTVPLNLEKPTVFYFSDNKTIDGDGEKWGQMVTGVLEEHLGGKDIYQKDGSAAQIYSVAYSRNGLGNMRLNDMTPKGLMYMGALKLSGKKDSIYRVPQIFAHQKNPDSAYSLDAKEFADRTLLPALEDDNGNLLPIDGLKDRLRNLTFVGNSYGSIFAKEVSNRLKEVLEVKGLDEAEAKEAIREIVLVAAPNVSKVQGQNNLLTGFYFEASNDDYRHYVQSDSFFMKPNQAPDFLQSDTQMDSGLIDKAKRSARAAITLSDADYNLVNEQVPDGIHVSNVQNGRILHTKLHNDVDEIYTHPRISGEAPEKQETFSAKDFHHHDVRRFILPPKHITQTGQETLADGYKDALFGRVLRNAVARGTLHKAGADFQNIDDFITTPSHLLTNLHAGQSVDDWLDHKMKETTQQPSQAGAMHETPHPLIEMPLHQQRVASATQEITSTRSYL